MKKVLIYSLIIVTILVLFIKVGCRDFSFNVKFNPTAMNTIEQKNDFSESNFYIKYYNSDKLICLNTWATWCKPCIEEIPALNSLKDSMKNFPIEFISLSIDKDSSVLKKFINKNEFEFVDISLENLYYQDAIINFLDGKRENDFLDVQSVPNTYIIKNKKVIVKFDGVVDAKELRNAIEKNL